MSSTETSAVVKKKPTAIIDKSLLQEICEQPASEVNGLMNGLRHQFQIIVPYILIEETLASLGSPPLGKDPAVFLRMFEQIKAFQSFWMKPVYEIAFQELVGRSEQAKIPRLAKPLAAKILNLDLADADFLAAVADRKPQRKSSIEERQSWQNALIRKGDFLIAKDTSAFFQILMRFLKDRLDDVPRRVELLESCLGERLIHEHPRNEAKIRECLVAVDWERIQQLRFVASYLMLCLIYQFGPLTKIGNPSSVRPLLSRRDQLGNEEDLQYAASAVVCDSLLTRDKGMRTVMALLKEDGCWDGRVVLFDPRADIVGQLSQVDSLSDLPECEEGCEAG